jgi:GxxExxY protein
VPRTLTAEHTAQLLGYLRGANRKHGLLINFGGSRLQVQKLIL